MKNFVKAIIILCVLFFDACTNDFNSIHQAGNEVNPKGYRDGNWADFFDSEDNCITDTTLGYHFYRLTVFKEGVPMKSSKFLKNGEIQSIDKPFETYKKLHEKSYTKMYFQESTFFTKDRDKTIRETYDDSVRANQIIWLNKNTPIANCKIQYYENLKDKSLKNIKLVSFDDVGDTLYYDIKFLKNSMWNNLNENVRIKLKEKTKYLLDVNIDSNSMDFERIKYLLEPLIAKKIFPYQVESLNINSTKIEIANIATSLQNDFRAKQIRLARINQAYNSRKNLYRKSYSGSRGTRRSPSSNNSYEPYRKCSWCSRGFRGNYYQHLGKLVPCHTASKKYPVTPTYCSSRCCSEARIAGIRASRRY